MLLHKFNKPLLAFHAYSRRELLFESSNKMEHCNGNQILINASKTASSAKNCLRSTNINGAKYKGTSATLLGLYKLTKYFQVIKAFALLFIMNPLKAAVYCWLIVAAATRSVERNGGQNQVTYLKDFVKPYFFTGKLNL